MVFSVFFFHMSEFNPTQGEAHWSPLDLLGRLGSSRVDVVFGVGDRARPGLPTTLLQTLSA